MEFASGTSNFLDDRNRSFAETTCGLYGKGDKGCSASFGKVRILGELEFSGLLGGGQGGTGSDCEIAGSQRVNHSYINKIALGSFLQRC